MFACMEFESWLIPGARSLAGVLLADGQRFPTSIRDMPPDPETAPRDAKGWFRKKMGYKPTLHQAELTRLVDFGLVRDSQVRSFRRLEHAIEELVEAIRSGAHRVTPVRD